ncbi:sporulation integral membrane protein YtvI [Faecalispora anaeroviscerum]|uniref:sporulation integral membrane protein YtvI n=1 Tax=Faecalispora anaeroviscerum TaxID=2991836 RepID=UPI0024BA6BE5|nr:sporulation integral membrane protein YtvI [Faecalispora anaeroviscerum]
MTRLKPLFVFFIGYTICFYLFALTLGYTFPFVAGFLLALMLQPLVRFLKEKLHLRPGFASILVTLLSFFLLFGLMALLGYWLVTEITTLVVRLSSIDTTKIIKPLNDLMGYLGIYVNKIDSDFIRQNQEQLIKFLQTGAGIITSVLNTVLMILTSLPGILTMFIVMIFSTYFFAKDMPKIKRQVASFLSQNTVINIRSASRHSLTMSGKLLASFLLIYLITFLQTLLVFYLLGVPYPLVLSLIAGIADVLPILGPGTVYIPLAVISLAQGDFFTAVALIVAWLLISTIRQVIQPKIVSASIDIHPLSMLAALYFALVAGRVSILIYMTVFFVLYQVLCKTGVLPRLFVSDSDSDKQGKRPIPPAQRDDAAQPEPPADS